MEVEVTSRETIKPSSPTPPHLRTYKISLLDQLLPPSAYIQPVIYYPPTKSNDVDSFINHRLPQLKSSLSETLARFYPIAGRIKDDHTIDCNDQGARFCVARVKCHMGEVMREQSKIDRLLPRKLELTSTTGYDDVQLDIQVSIHNCGGIAIGMNVSHRIIDAVTLCSFLKCWAARSCGGGGGIGIYPDYSVASIYPPAELQQDTLSSVHYFERVLLTRGSKVSTRRFVFNDTAISTLKARATSKLVPDPTRIEVVSCFIWKHAMAAARVVTGGRQPSALGCQVNLRRIMAPPLAENTVGNILWKAIACCDEDATEEMELDGLVGLLRGALKKIKDEIVPKAQGVGGYDAVCKYAEEINKVSRTKNLNCYMFNSWCRLGFYDLDFGWGKPTYIGTLRAVTDSLFKNYIYLTEHSGCEEVIEAFVILEQSQMATLENDPEFLAFASSIPTPAPSTST